jgi:hypothetical protein
MKKIRRTFVRKSASTIGYFPTKKTKQKDLQSLLAKLRPMTPEKGLIRIGPDDDGGYVVPNNLDGIQACYSPGVSTECRFDKACADMGMPVFMADQSVDGPPEEHANFHFIKKFIGVLTNEEFMTLDSWVESTGSQIADDFIMQIDIEGAEYEVFIAASDGLMNRFRVIIAEFHRLDLLFSRPYFELASKAFEKLLQTHTCVHIHPNNCRATQKQGSVEIPPVTEFTFLRKDCVGKAVPADQFPHPLDHDNASGPHIALPRCWYKD